MNRTQPESETKQLHTDEEDSLIEFRMEDIWQGFLKYWWVCIILMLLGAGVMFFRSYVRFTPSYECSATFTVQTQQVGAAGDSITSYAFTYNRSAATQLASTFPSIIKSNILQDIIRNDLELSYVPATLTASSVSGTNMFTITAKGKDPDLTYQTLLAAIRNYPAVAEYVIGNTNLYMLSEPIRPDEPVNKMAYRRQTALGGIVGLGLGFAWIAVYALCRSTIRTRNDIRRKLNQHSLGVLPQVTFKKHKQEIDRSVLLTNPLLGDGYMESFRAIRNALVNENNKHRIIMLTSTAPGEGKSTTSVNLAISLSRMHLRVLLVDADLRNPSVNEMVGLPLDGTIPDNQPYGFTTLPNSTVTIMNFNTGAHKLWQFMRVDYLKNLFESLRSQYDYIIVDTAPCGLTSEPSIIAQSVDAAILIIRHDAVRSSRILNCIDALLQTKVKLLGCILNGVASGITGYGYSKYGYGHYGYGYSHYGYGYSKKKKSSAKQTEPTQE